MFTGTVLTDLDGDGLPEQGDNHQKVAWQMEAESFLRKMTVRFGGTETFHFDPDGRIRVAFADWQPAALADELMQRRRASLRASGHLR